MPKVYAYGVRNLELTPELEEQFTLASAYREKLIELELNRRGRIDAINAQHSPTLADALQRQAEPLALLEAYTDDDDDDELIKKATRDIRKRTNAELTELGKTIRAERLVLKELAQPGADAFKARKLERLEEIGSCGPRTKERVNAELLEEMITDESLPAIWRERAAVGRDHTAAVKAARANNGLTAGTSGLIDDEIEGAKRTPGEFGKTRAPRRVGVQIQTGVTLAELYTGRSNVVQVEPLPADQWSTRRGQDKAFTRFRMRLGVSPEVYASGTINMHRPLPDARITHVILVRKLHKGRITYSLQFTLRTPQREAPVTAGTCAVAIGWQPQGDDVLVAIIRDQHGREERFILPKMLKRSVYPGHVRGAADALFESAAPTIAEACASSDATIRWRIDGELQDVPVRELVERATRRHDVARRVVAAIAGEHWDDWHRWRKERLARRLDLFCGIAELARWLGCSVDDATLPWLQLWAIKDDHLMTIAANQMAKNARFRDDQFTKLASRLSREYTTVVVDARDLSRFAMRARGTRSNSVRQQSAPGGLRTKLKEHFGKDRYVAIYVKDRAPDIDSAAVQLLEQHASGAPLKTKAARGKQRKRSRGITSLTASG